jgi:hypothetical protein
MASVATLPEVQDPANTDPGAPDPAAGAAQAPPPAAGPAAPPVALAAIPVAVPVAVVPFEKADANLLAEIAEFRDDSEKRYRFNNGWDIVLSVLGIALSIGVVAVGFLKNAEFSAILGAVVGAVVTAQRAFPFGQRAGFYRLLIGQVRNLSTRATQGTLSKVEVINALSSLRMDFAQQLPRGSSAPASTTATPTPAPQPTPDGDAKPE